MVFWEPVQFTNDTSKSTNSPDSDAEFVAKFTEMISDFGIIFYIYLIIFVVGFCGNVRVLQIIVCRLKNRRRFVNRSGSHISDVYVLNLALADICTSLTLPIVIWCMANGKWTFGRMACKAYSGFDALSKFVSVLSIVLLSFDRYLAVCHPIWSRRSRTQKRAVIMAISAWLIVGILTAPTFILADLLEDRVEFPDPENSSVMIEIHSTKCVIQLNHNKESQNDANTTQSNITSLIDLNYEDRSYHLFLLYNFFLNYLIPSILICVFYSLIVCRLHSRHQRITQSSTLNEGQSHSGLPVDSFNNNKLAAPISTEILKGRYMLRSKYLSSNEADQSFHHRTSRFNRSTFMILAIIVAYTLCWLPYWLLQLLLEFDAKALYEFFDYDEVNFKIFSLTAYGLQMTNSALNPYFYLITTRPERRSLKGKQLLKLINNNNVVNASQDNWSRKPTSVISIITHNSQAGTSISTQRHTITTMGQWSQDWSVKVSTSNGHHPKKFFSFCLEKFRSDDRHRQTMFAGHVI